MPNPDNDVVEIYEDQTGEWRWRRVDGNNGKIVSDSGEGYVRRSDATAAARAYNVGILTVVKIKEAEK